LVIGTGGAMALLPTARRQRYTELTLVRTDRDATERRITELYTKAAELLGSGQVSVRMAGLYVLERLAHRRASPIHCRCNTGTAWNRLTLAGALLPDFSLAECQLGHANFMGVLFTGVAYFGGPQFVSGSTSGTPEWLRPPCRTLCGRRAG
jgi:hypothetical protein